MQKNVHSKPGGTTNKKLRVAIIAPPWLTIPPKGYGGIEVMLYELIVQLKKQGVEVEVFGVKGSKIPGVKIHALTAEPEFRHIYLPFHDSIPIVQAHLQTALKMIEADGKFDVIHDHTVYAGPYTLAWATRLKYMPPSIHTMHGPPFSTQQSIEEGIPDNRPFWSTMGGNHHSYVVCISDAMKNAAPKELAPKLLPTVYNAIDVNHFPFNEKKKNYFITLARFTPVKGQHLAVKYCIQLRYRLRMSGIVADIETNRKLLLELANPLSKYRSNNDFRYFSDKILPSTVRYKRITYSGNVKGHKKMAFLAEAKALLFPIQWEEPFGVAVIEALACGTPVVAFRRGAMSEIIKHGYNGFLADTEEEFKEYMQRVDEIEPANCRASVENMFSAETMAQNYIKRYETVIAKKKADKSLG